MFIEIELVGKEEVTALIAAFGVKVQVASLAAAYDEAQFEFEMTQELVPIDTGALLSSGRVEHDPMGAAIAYGGPAGSAYGQKVDVDYALAVHEDLYAHHPHGQAKFVEAVVRKEEASGRTAERMSGFVLAHLQVMGAFSSKGGSYTKSGLSGRFTGSIGATQG